MGREVCLLRVRVLIYLYRPLKMGIQEAGEAKTLEEVGFIYFISFVWSHPPQENWLTQWLRSPSTLYVFSLARGWQAIYGRKLVR